MNLLPGLQSTASALDAERLRMNVVAENIANASTTRDSNGQPYQRKIVSFESVLSGETGTGASPVSIVHVSGVTRDTTEGNMVYNPQHPDANEQGMVRMPNVETSREMVDLIVSSRAYEANLQVARASRQMAKQALTIGSKS
jgi:flagellar basal-body rod protein FlgC